jgi:hypothetical protein
VASLVVALRPALFPLDEAGAVGATAETMRAEFCGMFAAVVDPRRLRL